MKKTKTIFYVYLVSMMLLSVFLTMQFADFCTFCLESESVEQLHITDRKNRFDKGELMQQNCVSKVLMFSILTNDYYCSNQTWYTDMISLEDAWVYQGTNTVKIGIIDTGIDINHPDLANKIDANLSCSFIDDDPFIDYVGHGTAVAGIIAANINNNIGIYGINTNVELVSIKVSNSLTINASETADYANRIASAINYAQTNGIKLINASLGVDVSTTSLEAAVSNYDGLLVCASGNSYACIDILSNYIYPQCYSAANILVVGSCNQNDSIAYLSNYGVQNVDVFAPGDNLISTISGSSYLSVSGTSFAAPVVTGVASLMLSRYPCISPIELKSNIMNSVDILLGSTPYYNGCASHGRLNARESMKLALNHIHYQAINDYYHREYCDHQTYGYYPHNWVLSSVFPMSIYQLDYIPSYVCSDCGLVSMSIPV